MRVLPSTALVFSLAVLLSACGGGDEGVIVNENPPEPTGLSGSVAVTAAGDATLNGTYASSSVALNNVTKVNPIGGEPETCRFRFSGLQQAGSTRMMDGDIRYIPGTNELRSTFVSINTVEFQLQGTVGGTVDRTNNRIVFTGAQLTSSQGTGQTITLTGFVPMLPNRPEGC